MTLTFVQNQDLSTLFQSLQGTGFYTILLPFLLTFAIVYGVLHNLGIFGSKNSQVSAVIGIAIAFFVADAGILSEFLMGAAGYPGLAGPLALLFFFLLMLVAGAGIVGWKIPGEEGLVRYFGAAALVAVAALIYLQGGVEAVYGSSIPLPGVSGGINLVTVVVLLAAAGLVYWLVKGGGSGGGGEGD